MTELTLPPFFEREKVATIVTWFVNEGEYFREGDNLVEVLVQETTYKIVADVSGVLRKVRYAPGDEVPFLELLALIDEQK